ncbi:MAG: hypothetical protein IJH50_12510 [Kiritimatiellae bacterium]|nr:hypothetical protein [Kiritimatiellia bacterium]
MERRVLIPAALAFAAASIASADPYIGYIYPAGIQIGATNRLVIGGQNLNRIAGVHFSRGGLRVLKIENVPFFPTPTGTQRRHLVKWLNGIAAGVRQEPPLSDDWHPEEWRSNSWWRALGSLDAGKIAIVERDLYVPRNTLQATPSLRQMLLVTVAVEPDAAPGRGELCVYGPGGISAPRPFETTAAPHVAEPLFAPPHRPAPERPPVEVGAGGAVVLDGQTMPGETDVFRLRLGRGRHYTFRTTARELQPYIGDAVPGFFNAALVLKGGSGAVVARADDECRFRPDPVMEFTPPEEGVYRLEIHDVLYRGRADFVYSITVTEGAAAPSPCPQNVDGVVARPGEVCRKEIEVERPGRLVLDVAARRLGSPLDAVLTLRRAPGGPVLAQWDDVTNTVFVGTVPQAECDPIGVFDLAESGRYVAEVTDRTGHGGPGYFWRLDVHPPQPGFEVCSTRSTLPLARKVPLKVKFHVLRRDGFDGAVSLEFPEGVRVVDGVATAGVDVVTAQLFSRKGGVPKPRPVEVFAAAEIDGRTVRVPVVPCDEYEQAFAWKHLVPAESFLLMSK